MRKIYFLIILTLFVLKVNAQVTNFFVHAHQDDAVYFAGNEMYTKISSGEKTIFIVLSASDQGAHNGVYLPDAKVNQTIPFYKARDYGLMKAIEYCYTDYKLPLDFNESSEEVIINGKKLRKWTYGEVVFYSFDLPNGDCCSLNMNGYAANNYESIEKLKKGSISLINNVNNTASFTWSELKNTVKAIFELEKNISSYVYSSDVDFNINPNDHADHYIASVVALEAMDGISGFNSKLHVDYDLDNEVENLTEAQKIRKISTFGAMVSGIATKGYRANRHFQYQHWFTAEHIRNADSHNELINLNSNLGGNPFAAPNLALNKTTSVSGYEYSSISSKANDGDKTTYWANSPAPQWWKVDLVNEYSINKIVLFCYYLDTRSYQFTIEKSIDGVNWQMVSDYSTNTNLSTQNGYQFDFSTPVVARFFRVNMSKNSANNSVHIVEFEAYGDLNIASKPNLALNKTITASGSESTTTAVLANDGNVNTYWGNTPSPQWLSVDLGATFNVKKLNVVNYYLDSRYYQYTIDSSVDGVTWVQVVDYSTNTTLSTKDGAVFNFVTPIVARYFRVNMTKNSKNQGVHVVEFRAYEDEVSLNRNTSNNTNKNSKEVSIIKFMNPVKKGDILDIDVNNLLITDVSIFNLSGIKMNVKFDLSKSSYKIHTENLDKGIYFVVIDNLSYKLIIE